MAMSDEIRALKRELVGTRAKLNPQVRSEILAQLALRGDKPAAAPVEKRAPGRPKKSAE